MVSPENGAKPPLALIAGPTASGKSDSAVDLALSLGRAGMRASVINADSAQVYGDLRIISARPGPRDMRGVEHLLYGTWDGATPCSAADWAEAAKVEIARLHQEGGIPILCGGTGMYMRVLLDGIAPVPPIADEIREGVRALSGAEARLALESEDGKAAEWLAPGDTGRTMRALEVVRATGRPLADWQKEKSGGIGDTVSLHPALLLPEREELYRRCDMRFRKMIDRGAVDEVRALLARNLDLALPVMRAIGVPEIAAFLAGEATEDEMIARGQQATRNYAKRQFTWFNRQPPAEWPRLSCGRGLAPFLAERMLPVMRLTRNNLSSR